MKENLILMGYGPQYCPELWVKGGEELIPELRDLGKEWTMLGDSILLGLGLKFLRGLDSGLQHTVGKYVRREIGIISITDLRGEVEDDRALYCQTLATMVLSDRPGVALYNALVVFGGQYIGRIERV